MNRVPLLIGLMLLVLLGCNPGVRVVKSPGEKDRGIRYYRPKPYLFLTAGGANVIDKDKNTKISPSDQYVNIELKYLPDFSEEYSINVTPGLGTATVNVTLEDGWNLTTINQVLDSNVDDNIAAVADLTKAVGGLIGTASDTAESGDSMKLADNVAARNVPLGFYEAVIGRDNCGRKQMYGWRYIGFTPFAQCRIYSTGQQTACRNDGSLDLYGLVFENGVMVFRPLCNVQTIPNELSSLVTTASSAPEPAEDTKTRIAEFQATLELALQGNATLDDKNLKILGIIDGDTGLVFKVQTTASQNKVSQAITPYLLTNRSVFGDKPFTVEVTQPASVATNFRSNSAGRATLSSSR